MLSGHVQRFRRMGVAASSKISNSVRMTLSEAVVSASSKKCLRGIQIGLVVTRIFRDELGVHGAMAADRIMGRDPIWGKLRIRDNRERFFEE